MSDVDFQVTLALDSQALCCATDVDAMLKEARWEGFDVSFAVQVRTEPPVYGATKVVCSTESVSYVSLFSLPKLVPKLNERHLVYQGTFEHLSRRFYSITIQASTPP